MLSLRAQLANDYANEENLKKAHEKKFNASHCKKTWSRKLFHFS